MSCIYVNRTVDVEVEVELDDIDDDEMCDELERRGYKVIDKEEVKSGVPAFYNQLGEPIGSLVEELYHAYTSKNSASVDKLLQELFYQSIGRIA
jgi:hypothetical protein